jgi:hypothetical protein
VGTDLHATSGHWMLDGDPLQGALVSFRTEQGDIEVHGSFSGEFDYVTPPEGFEQKTSWVSPWNGNYTAILVWDGKELKLLRIS